MAKLNGAKKPLILLGGGALGAGKAAVEIAEKLKAPIITTTAGKGAVPTDHPLCLGQILAREGFWTLVAESDAILCVGSELSETDHWNDSMAIEKNLIRIDLDPAVMGRPHTAEIAILGDAREALELIAKGIADKKGKAEATSTWASPMRCAPC